MAQNSVPTSMLDVDFSRVDWERGEVLVRFSDALHPRRNSAKDRVGIFAVDQVLMDYTGVKLEQLFPVQKPIPSGAKGFTTYTGRYYEYPKLTNIYKISFKDTTWDGIFPLISALENLGSEYVVYAEPNYKFETDVTVPPTDALYQYQYNASSMNADSAWQIMNDSAYSDEDIIIAIIDTGVDTAHVDLKGKKHLNMIEVNGVPGVDDDGNGYVDDISGWDFVNMDNGPIDDNSHGTHCAAIAVANHDSVGIAGIAPKAKYLPMKGLESSGGSASSVLAQCVTYAANNGADILSMSFGGYGRSFVMENALSYAYAFSMPVGAAGNNGICIRNDGQLCPDGTPPAPMFPGAYTFVLAVQATQQNVGWNGYRAWFTNYDFDGPTYTDYGDDFNYEVYAPGLGIISAIPGNQYATWNGTSMACPAVAGAMAVYQTFRPNRTKEQAFVDFISSWYDLSKTFDKGQGWSTNFQSMDLVKALYPEPQPLLWLNEFTVIDTANGDGDFKLDAGESVQVRVDIKNVGTEADSVYVGIRMAQYEDKTIIDFNESISFIGSISSYAIVSNNTAMFDLDVDAGVVNGRNINFNIYCWTPGGDTTSQDFFVEAQSGCEYNGIYTGTTIWTPDCGIIVTGNSVFDTLIIEPGTEIQIDPGVGIAFNEIQAIGKPDSMIVFTKNQNSYGTWMELKNVGNNHQTFEYCVFEYGGRSGSVGGGEIIGSGHTVSIENCIMRYCHAYYGQGWNLIRLSGSASVTNSVFVNNFSNLAIVGIEDDNWSGKFEGNLVHDNRYQQYYGEQPFLSFRTQNDLSRIENNSFFRHNYSAWGSTRNTGYVLGVRDGNGGGHQFSLYTGNVLDSNYFGFSNTLAIESNVFDFQEESSFPAISAATNALSKPKSQAHGHVWKIMVDDTVDININDNPIHHLLGLGTHKVSVYFNRPMDVSVNPFVTYGVRDPWTQNIIGDSTSWSSDSMVWSGYLNITQLTASDGYNTLSVRHAYDNEGFISPIEDYRFQFRINVAGVLSTGFSAVGDTSEIRLSWEAPDSIVDLIGYNILRIDTSQYNHDTSIINSSLVMDTNYTDENVVGGKYYLYYYEPVRSSFTESQRSIGVWATPYSSKPRVKTLKATEPTNGSLTFNSGVDANFIETEARFKFGTSKTSLNNATSWQVVGSDYFEVPYSRGIQSALPGTVYYYQVEAKNSLGTTTGAIDSILTRSTPAITISGQTSICLGDSISLSAQFITNDSTLTVEWLNSGMSIGQGTSLEYYFANAGTQTISARLSGSYTNTTTANVQVEVVDGASTPVAINYTGATSFCQGQTLTLSLPSGYSDIVWNTGDTTSTVVVSQTGTYSASLTSLTSGCSFSSNSINVTVNALPTATVTTTSGDFDFCDGSSLMLDAPSGAAGYQWYNNGTAVIGATGPSYSAVTSGSYAVEVTSAVGCTSLSAAQSVTKNTNPTATITNLGSSLLCNGDSAILTAPSGFASYAWSNGINTISTTVFNPGFYSVTITDTNGCSGTSPSLGISASSFLPPTVIVSGNTEFCEGQAVTLGIPMGYSSYFWSNGALSTQVVATTSGDYYAQVMNADGCTTNSDTVTVQVFPTPPTPSISYTANDTVMTSSEATGNQWYFNGNMMPGETGQTLRPMNLGNYSVMIIDTNGCEGDMSAMQFYNSIGVGENLSDQVKVYPNPTTGQLTVVVGNLAVAQVVLMDATGREVARYGNATGSELHLDLSEEAAGMYVLQLILEDGSTLRRIIGKQ